MKVQKIKICLFCLVVTFISFAQTDKSGLSKINTNDNYDFISVNQIKMWVSNNGDGSHDPQTSGSGFYWPGGPSATKTAVYEDGLVWGGIVNGQIRVNGNTHRQGLQAGKILLNGIPDDPNLSKYRVYKILKGWENLPPGSVRDEYELDYNEWPVEDGAPWIDVNGDGTYTPGVDKPKYVGDETLWYVANDMDTTRTTFTYGSLPIGLEFQTTIWAFDSSDFLGDVVFKKYRIINKGSESVDSLFLCYWNDPDLGDAVDDYMGYDKNLNFGYMYNQDNDDGGGIGNTYGTPPPAIAQMLLQTPVIPSTQNDSGYFNERWHYGYKNIPLSSFTIILNSHPMWSDPSNTPRFYNLMNGLLWDGAQVINPHTNQATKFSLSGDPVALTGWYEGSGWPGGPTIGDRRYVINSGPITLAVADTQEVVIAIFMSIGTDNINSVAELKQKAQQIQNFYGAFVPNIVSVDDDLTNLPTKFQLMQNYPNPFNPTTKISWQSPVSSHQTLKVYDLLGREVATLVNEERPAGNYEVEFSAIGGSASGGNATGLSSGVYFYKLQAGDFVQTRKMILVK